MSALQRTAVWATPGPCNLNSGPGFVSCVNVDKVQLYGGLYR